MIEHETKYRNSLHRLRKFFSLGWDAPVSSQELLKFWFALSREERDYYRYSPKI